jgi:hypothetical protein
MSLIGSHTLTPTSDPQELATRTECANAGHRPVTFNPWHDATWCRCGAEVVADNHGLTPAPRTPPRTMHLQGIGKVLAVPLADIRAGDTLMWNYGATSQVVSVEPVTAATYVLTERAPDGKTWTRRKRGTTLVCRVQL